MSSRATSDAVEPRSSRWMLPVILLLTAGIVLAWGHVRLLDQDEVFVLQTDSVRSVHALIDVQRHYPISLDPLFYHLLSHACVRLLGATAFAIRLPSLAGYLLMQVCLFLVGRTLAGERAGLVAAAIPALTATLFYGVEARPYGLLLGLSALVLLSWLRSAGSVRGRRTGWLMTLAVTLALALNTHYFAVLLLVPLCGAEFFRAARTRRVDWPVFLAIAMGMAGIGFTLPFQHAAGEFRLHYYNAGNVGPHAVTQSYRALFINYTNYSMSVQHVVMAVLVVLVLALLAALWRGIRKPASTSAVAGQVYLLLLATLPFAGFLLARFVTHAIEVRYVLPTMVALSLLIAMALRPQRWPVRGFHAAMSGLLLMTALAGAERVREESAVSHARLAALVLSAELRERLLATPGTRLYVQNLGSFEEDVPYIEDAAVRDRITLLYSSGEELRWLRHDTAALTAMHLRHFTSVPVMSYEDLKLQPGEHLLLLRYGGGWNWIDSAFTEDHARVQQFTHALDGDIVAVQFSERQP